MWRLVFLVWLRGSIRWHDRMGLRVYIACCWKYDVKCADVWYKEVPDRVELSEDGNVEIWWDRRIETIQKMEYSNYYCPDVAVVD